MEKPANNTAQHRKPIHERDVFHLWMLADRYYAGRWEMPIVKASHAEPTGLVPFTLAMRHDCTAFDCHVHFHEDDYRFERLWRDPQRYVQRLKQFKGVIMPEYSTCIDFPKPLKMWNSYRNHLLAAWLQEQGIDVIPCARHQPGCPWLLDGIPRRSTIAICGRGLMKDPAERRRFLRDVRATVDRLDPTLIVYYGSKPQTAMAYPISLGIPVRAYPPCSRGVLDWRNGYGQW